MRKPENLLGKKYKGQTVNIVLEGTVESVYSSIDVSVDKLSVLNKSSDVQFKKNYCLGLRFFSPDDRSKLKVGTKTVHIYGSTFSNVIEYSIKNKNRIFRPFSL